MSGVLGLLGLFAGCGPTGSGGCEVGPNPGVAVGLSGAFGAHSWYVPPEARDGVAGVYWYAECGTDCTSGAYVVDVALQVWDLDVSEPLAVRITASTSDGEQVGELEAELEPACRCDLDVREIAEQRLRFEIGLEDLEGEDLVLEATVEDASVRVVSDPVEVVADAL